MIPYAEFPYFLWVAGLVLPSIVLGFFGRFFRIYNLIVTLIFIWLIYGIHRQELIFLASYTVWQWVLIRSFLKWRKGYPLAIVLSVLPLVWAKLVPVMHISSWTGFLGISYLTFKCVQMIIEIRDGQIKQVPILTYLQFLLFFPTISSGPIDRYRRFERDLRQPPSAGEYRKWFMDGLHLMFIGFFYKFVLAYLIDKYWVHELLYKSKTFAHGLSYMYGYSFYLFFDFAGYSAFAIAVSLWMGIRTPNNFHLPFLSRSPKDFWNRWHISLSTWFRDYVYMRFVFWMSKKRWITNKFILSSLGYILLFGLMGFWHGFEVQYILYGMYHAFLMILFDAMERKGLKYKSKWTQGIFTAITFQLVCFGFLIFSGYITQ